MGNQTGYSKQLFPCRVLLARAAAAIVTAHPGADLRGLVVVIPDLHAVGDVARALLKAANAPVLMLPHIVTLTQWANTVPLPQPVASRAARELALYQALAERDWLKHTNLWAVAAELAGLFDELTRYNVHLADGLDDFARRLEQAYRARPATSLRLEAQLVHELWWAMSRDTAELSSETAYQLRLTRLAKEARLPLYTLALDRLAPGERDFLNRYAERAEVVSFEIDTAAVCDGVTHTLAAAWPVSRATALRDRAAALALVHPESALANRLRVFEAVSAEQEAQAIDVTVREWLLGGKKSIAVVVQDRVVARRARALLERADVLVADEAGWALSTTSAATVVGRWLDVVADNCYHQDLLDFMKSPFAFHEMVRAQRQQAVWRFERHVREANVVSGLDNFLVLARRHVDTELIEMLGNVQQARAMLTRGRKGLADWLRALKRSLDLVGVSAGLEADIAGVQLSELLAERAGELEHDDTQVSFGDWRRWLAREVEFATFRDRTIESPVVFTYLPATRLRDFDAVLICGCDAQHLPGTNPVPAFFNQGVRAELGLPTRSDEVSEIERDLAALIATSGEIVLTWQRRLEGEENLFSPILERLIALHRLAYGDDLTDRDLAARLPCASVQSPDGASLPERTVQPKPSVPPALIPSEISVSAYNDLVACPYRFYARHVLRLGELDEVQELMDKRDYGSLLHGLLAKFHARTPYVSDIDPTQAQSELAAMSDAAFGGAITANYLAGAWLLNWKALIPKYLDWQREREAQGWRWHASEASRRVEITTPAGRKLVVKGRLDRVDVRAGEVAVVDYKTSSREALRKKLKVPGEDVQLPVYALLWGGPVAAALFLAVERNVVNGVSLEHEITALVEDNRERLARIYDALHTGAGLAAQGVSEICEYCEARGICRRDYW